MARKFTVSLFVLVSISGCAVGWTANRQPLPIPTVAAFRAPGQNPCGLDFEHGGSSSYHGVDFFGTMPVYGQGYMEVMAGAGRFIKECSIGQALVLTADATNRIALQPYGTNPYWQAQTVSFNPSNDPSAETKKKALEFYLKTVERLRKGGQPAEASETTAVAPTATVAPNFADSLVAAEDYGPLISVLEREASVNPDHAELCRKFASRLRIESVKTNHDFGHDKLEVLKAF